MDSYSLKAAVVAFFTESSPFQTLWSIAYTSGDAAGLDSCSVDEDGQNWCRTGGRVAGDARDNVGPGHAVTRHASHVTHHTALHSLYQAQRGHAAAGAISNRTVSYRYYMVAYCTLMVPGVWKCQISKHKHVLWTFLLIMMPWIFYLKAFVYNWCNMYCQNESLWIKT